MDPTPAPDPMLAATLRQMADIALPPPVSMLPATWGWAALFGLVALVLAAVLWHRLRQYKRNRYRREALAELSRFEKEVDQPSGRRHAMQSLPALVKRTALAAWQRETVASLSGKEWSDFLEAHAGRARIDGEAYRFFAESEYRPATLAAMDEATARQRLAAARQWIEGHNVRP
ncbi:hypothetical protein BMJ34_16515 [Sinorhizobium medicae]|uniref:DUF4381 family protein n=2 Tax=Sinorhizobium medicae TaxID=110321 RepID=A0A508WZY4_9HYPH|nr:DUF4381 domain-containing protein [Sinorhizobium medicae]MBO1942305.1 DUF4381 domain-containing protein [Sinorhizobium medicae]MBO1961325.1 DUF4381 domain-containing protein [Sinorhizobium medicae]MDX0455083.1 DUF4381 family protein [Sinorhizobium medicae]MDX0514375.1 DUF4381 family protein [Sinorhizobium medicae]MDX0547120.1 DUF4381 family protein [Sinorhizobium medicae]